MANSEEMREILLHGDYTKVINKRTSVELHTAMREGKAKANRSRITLVGPGRAGKTCVARSFLDKQFKDTPSTQGIDDMGLWTDIYKAEARERGRIPKVGGEKGVEIMENEGLDPLVSVLDLGGSEVFEVLQSFILIPNGVYLVVFDMKWMQQSDEKDDKVGKLWCLERLESWLYKLVVQTSVPDRDNQLKCSSIALVGTHKDEVPDAEIHREISNELQKLLSSSIAWRSLLEYETEDGQRLCFFPVDCTKGQADPTMVNLMTAIETDILISDYVNVERPLSYFKVLDEINERKKTVSYLSLDEVSEIMKKNEMKDVLMEDMLRFFTQLGAVLWFEESSLRNMVVLERMYVEPFTTTTCCSVVHNLLIIPLTNNSPS